MTGPLLRTKFYIPPLRPDAQWVSRLRLVERLNEGLRHGRKVTLLSAPAGYGKTTLLIEWIQRGAGADLVRAPEGDHRLHPVRDKDSPLPRIAWVSLDGGDNEPTRFWSYVRAALRTAWPDLPEARPAQPLEASLANLTNDLADLPGPLLLVLDDYHAIDEAAIQDALAYLIDHLAPQVHVVIATRADPSLPLARWRGRGELSELRQADLAFTRAEVAALLDRAGGLGLAEADVVALAARTEGWIAGLQMAVLSLQGRDDAQAQRFVRAFAGSHRYVLDYLTDEVLLRQPEAIQAFLLQTSILERLTGSLCDAVTGPEAGGEKGQTTLEGLDVANLFVVPLDDERRWYRYHHLFADLLRGRLERTQADRVTILHGRASTWYEGQGLIAEAVHHALAAGDAGRVARLVGGSALAMMEHGELWALERRLDALPGEAVRAQPWLCIAHAWMLAHTGQLDAIEPLLVATERGLAEGPDGEGRWQHGHVACIRAFVAGVRGDVRRAEECAREALALLPAGDLLTRGWATMSLGLTLGQRGDLTAGEQALAEAAEISRAAGASHVAVLALCNLAAIQTGIGHLHRAADAFREALRLAAEYADRTGRRLPVSAYAQTHLASLLCEWNDLGAAMAYARQGTALAEQWGEPQLLVGGHLQVAAIHASVGDIEGALDAIRVARRAASGLSSRYVARVARVEALVRLRQGDLEAASRWAEGHREEAEGGEDRSQHWADCLASAEIDIARGRLDEALDALAEVHGAAERVGAPGLAIASLVLRALALHEQGSLDRALDALGDALALAEPEGYVRTFIDRGTPMGALLQSAVVHGVGAGYAGRLLAAMSREGEPAPAEGGDAASLLVEPLTEREEQVLRLIAAGLTNSEIAEQLYLSVNTVKTHASTLYGKLGVHTRTQAANRAEELGLL